MQKQTDGLEVQELVFSKDVFESASDVETWARDHDFIAENIDETDVAFILQQRDPQEFEEGSLRSVDLAEGIKATMGKLKVPQKDAFQDCVSSKIRKLRGEGVKPDEAVAQALAFCRSEQGKSCELNLNQLQSAFELAKSIKDPGQQISASGDDPTNFGDPHLDVAKQTNVLLGQLVREVQLLSEKLDGLKQPEYDNPDDTAETGDSSEPSSMNDNLKNEKLGLIEMYKKECERILRQVGC